MNAWGWSVSWAGKGHLQGNRRAAAAAAALTLPLVLAQPRHALKHELHALALVWAQVLWGRGQGGAWAWAGRQAGEAG